jgi:DNA-directed RNA polymerase specialized sigma24 family protein
MSTSAATTIRNDEVPRGAGANALTPERFHRFLAWIAPDAETAAERYVEMRARLSRLFEWRGCDRPDELADMTLDRVMRKLDHVAHGYVGEPAAYVHGVAKKIYLEYARARRKERLRLVSNAEMALLRATPPRNTENDPEEERHALLERGLDALDSEERELILSYYRGEDPATKIAGRDRLARDSGVSRMALRKRTQRIRTRLRALLFVERADA